MVTDHHDLRLAIEFMAGTGRHIAHGDMLAAFDVSGGILPRLADVVVLARVDGLIAASSKPSTYFSHSAVNCCPA